MPTELVEPPSPASTSASEGPTPKKSKNAAAQFRRRKRISHPLMDPPSPSPSTPVKTRQNGEEKREGSHTINNATPPRSLFTIEDIAARAEAEFEVRRREKSLSPKTVNRKAARVSCRPPSPSVASVAHHPNRLWYSIVFAIVVPFLLCESILTLLVIRCNYLGASSVFGDGKEVLRKTVTPDGLNTAKVVDAAPEKEELTKEIPDMGQIANDDDGEEETLSIENEDDTEQSYDTTLSGKVQDEEEEEKDVQIETRPDEVEIKDLTTGEKEMSLDEEVVVLQSMLSEGFDILTRKGGDSAESVCESVWSRVKEVLSLNSLESLQTRDGEDDTPMENDNNSSTEDNTWKALALDAQRCLGGSRLATLSRDIEESKLQAAREIFERLGIFLNANKKSPTIAEDEEQISLLKLATFHLKVASSLCTTSRGPILQPRKKAELDTPSNTDVLSTTAPKEESSDQKNIATKGGKQLNQNAESNAAILHNLALAYIAMGETNSSVPALLRAASLRRQSDTPPTNNIYWNIPEDLLQQTEEKALLMGAKTKRGKTLSSNSLLPSIFHFTQQTSRVQGHRLDRHKQTNRHREETTHDGVFDFVGLFFRTLTANPAVLEAERGQRRTTYAERQGVRRSGGSGGGGSNIRGVNRLGCAKAGMGGSNNNDLNDVNLGEKSRIPLECWPGRLGNTGYGEIGDRGVLRLKDVELQS
eukprot:scaffold4296_cov144-Alexandrium_tamarense.AAC.2